MCPVAINSILNVLCTKTVMHATGFGLGFQFLLLLFLEFCPTHIFLLFFPSFSPSLSEPLPPITLGGGGGGGGTDYNITYIDYR